MTDTAGNDDLIRIVLADANVLYSRVLRDTCSTRPTRG